MFLAWAGISPQRVQCDSKTCAGSVYNMKSILQAEDDVGLPEEILDQPNFESAAKLYFVYTRLDVLWSLNYFALIVLSFFEVISSSFFIACMFLFSILSFKRKGTSLVHHTSFLEGIITLISSFSFLTSLQRPLWCARYSEVSCNDRGYYFLGQLPYLTSTESLVFEVCRLFLFCFLLRSTTKMLFCLAIFPQILSAILKSTWFMHIFLVQGNYVYVSDPPYLNSV